MVRRICKVFCDEVVDCPLAMRTGLDYRLAAFLAEVGYEVVRGMAVHPRRTVAVGADRSRFAYGSHAAYHIRMADTPTTKPIPPVDAEKFAAVTAALLRTPGKGKPGKPKK